jgi:hypothetical protein
MQVDKSTLFLLNDGTTQSYELLTGRYNNKYNKPTMCTRICITVLKLFTGSSNNSAKAYSPHLKEMFSKVNVNDPLISMLFRLLHHSTICLKNRTTASSKASSPQSVI